MKNGAGRLQVRATVAGQLALRASFPKAKEKAEFELREASYTAQVTASACAGMFDMVPLAQSADAGMTLMVYARDSYGNLDETCESTVTVPGVEPAESPDVASAAVHPLDVVGAPKSAGGGRTRRRLAGRCRARHALRYILAWCR